MIQKYSKFLFKSSSYISSIISLYKTVENKTYEVISELLFKNLYIDSSNQDVLSL